MYLKLMMSNKHNSHCFSFLTVHNRMIDFINKDILGSIISFYNFLSIFQFNTVFLGKLTWLNEFLHALAKEVLIFVLILGIVSL